MIIRGDGPQILVRINYLQALLGDFVIWELVVILVRTFNTASSSCVMRSKSESDRVNYIYCVEHELLVIVSSRNLCSLMLSNHIIRGNEK